LQRSLERSHRSPWRSRSTTNSGKGVESFHGENLFNLFLEEQKMGTLGLTGAFAAGLVLAVGPSSLPIISVIAGYVIGAEEERRLPRLLGFLAGIVVAGIILGIIFAGAGWLLGTVIGPAWNGIIGLVLLVMGLRLLRVLKFRGIAFQTERQKVGSPWAAFLFGMPFVFAI